MIDYKRKLKYHNDEVHMKIRNYVCSEPSTKGKTGEECGYSTYRKRALEAHKKYIHEKIKTIFCNKCDYATYYKGALLSHINSHHEKIRNYVCEKCDYASPLKTNLKRHRQFGFEM